MLMSIIPSNIQLLIVNTYLLILQDFFFRLKPNQYKNANIADCLKNIWKLMKQNKLSVESFDEKPAEN